MEHLFLLVILPLLVSVMAPGGYAAQAVEVAKPIYDTDGHELTSDNHYHVIRADGGRLGGEDYLYAGQLRVPAPGCPLRVVLGRAKDPRDLGMPVSITPASNYSGGPTPAPRLSSDLFLAFNRSITMCKKRLRWHITLGITNQMHVTVGQPQGSEPEARTFLFRVERHGGGGAGGGGATEGYKMMACYGDAEGKVRVCQDLGVYEFRGLKWLIVAEDGREPFVFVFKKCPPPCSP